MLGKAINEILIYQCNKEGFTYIDTSNIVKEDLEYDGLHLNKYGTTKLLDMLLNCCIERYNPYLC